MPLLIHLPKLPSVPPSQSSFCWAGAEGSVLQEPLQGGLSIPAKLPQHLPQQNQASAPVLQPNSSAGHYQQLDFPQRLSLCRVFITLLWAGHAARW